MSEHEKFEELSALAAIGELSAEELRELDEHLRECEPCRKASSEFRDVIQTEMPLLHKDHESLWSHFKRVIQPDKHTRRFLAAAKARGFTFSEEIKRSPAVRSTPLRIEHAAITALVIIAVSLSFVAIRWKHAYESVSAERYESQVALPATDRDALLARINDQEKLIQQIQDELSARQDELNIALATASRAENQHDVDVANERRLRAIADSESAKNAALSTKLDTELRHGAALADEVQRLNGLRGADAVEIAAQQKRLDEISQQLQANNEMLSSERQLLSAGRDIRDLMGARSLHIIDVFDTDQKGHNKKAFGRVFYTEGKSLIFYAFDLDNARVLDAKNSYQAWGVRDGGGQQAKNLGIFYVDDKEKRRWVLKSEDPAALQQIDSVFVTVEPFGGAKQPTGQKLLYAFLKNQPNHP
jgi:hypothetical protein